MTHFTRKELTEEQIQQMETLRKKSIELLKPALLEISKLATDLGHSDVDEGLEDREIKNAVVFLEYEDGVGLVALPGEFADLMTLVTGGTAALQELSGLNPLEFSQTFAKCLLQATTSTASPIELLAMMAASKIHRGNKQD